MAEPRDEAAVALHADQSWAGHEFWSWVLWPSLTVTALALVALAFGNHSVTWIPAVTWSKAVGALGLVYDIIAIYILANPVGTKQTAFQRGTYAAISGSRRREALLDLRKAQFGLWLAIAGFALQFVGLLGG